MQNNKCYYFYRSREIGTKKPRTDFVATLRVVFAAHSLENQEQNEPNENETKGNKKIMIIDKPKTSFIENLVARGCRFSVTRIGLRLGRLRLTSCVCVDD